MFNRLALSSVGTVAKPGEFLDWYPEVLCKEADALQRWLSQLGCASRAHGIRFRAFHKTAERIDA